MPDMLVKLYELPDASEFIQNLEKRNIKIRRAMPYEKHIVTEWVRGSFNESWASECDKAFSNHPVSCFIAAEAGKVIGFACYEATCRNFFGPAGTDESKRGMGIGRALLLSSLHAMEALGYGYAIIGGVGPAAFYERAVGAVIIQGSTPGIYKDRLKYFS